MNKKLFISFCFVLFALVFSFSLTTPVQADTFIFNNNLRAGVINPDVKELQNFFNTNGFIVANSGPGSLGQETTKFGSFTETALIKFQIANKITPAVGYFGPITRGVINKKIDSVASMECKAGDLFSSITGLPCSTVLTFPAGCTSNLGFSSTTGFSCATGLPKIRGGGSVGHVAIYSLTYTAGAHGSITGTSPQTVNHGSDGTAVTAVSDIGFSFINWSDGSTANPRTDTSVTNNISVTANFAWICGDTLIDSRDAQLYPTVLIGTQCWMAKNLNIGTRIDSCNTSGVGCPSNDPQNQGDYSGGIQKYCYDDDDANCTAYGGLYQWHMSMGFPQTCDAHDDTSPCIVSSSQQGICPTGWHMPSDNEWIALGDYLSVDGQGGSGDVNDVGGKLKEAGTINWESPNVCDDGTSPTATCNSSNFDALGAPGRWFDGTFPGHLPDTGASFWSTLFDPDTTDACSVGLDGADAAYYPPTIASSIYRTVGFSARCLKD